MDREGEMDFIIIMSSIKRRNIIEICLIVLFSICLGLGFNLISKNRIPYVAQSKSEQYAENNIRRITLSEAKIKFDLNKSIFLDARDAEAYKTGTIPGALSLPIGEFAIYYPQMERSLPKNANIVVFCTGIDCRAGYYLTVELIKMDYNNIELFEDGIDGWIKNHFPVK
jgi:rhodanese-related sulfurtransferase